MYSSYAWSKKMSALAVTGIVTLALLLACVVLFSGLTLPTEKDSAISPPAPDSVDVGCSLTAISRYTLTQLLKCSYNK